MNCSTIDSRNHSFNVGIAIDYNPTIALWLGHLAFWAEKNLANNKHIHDGLVWSYDTLEAIGDYFPYLTRRQIETMINNSVSAGLVQKGNYNKTQYDRTLWYALTPKAYVYFKNLLCEKYLKRLFLSISQKCEMDFTEFVNGFHTNVTPIPDTTPYPDPSSKNACAREEDLPKKIEPVEYQNTYYETKEKQQTDFMYKDNPHGLTTQSIDDYINSKAKKFCITSWLHINQELQKCKEGGISPQDAFNQYIASDWKSFSALYVIKDVNKTEKKELDTRSDWMNPKKKKLFF